MPDKDRDALSKLEVIDRWGDEGVNQRFRLVNLWSRLQQLSALCVDACLCLARHTYLYLYTQVSTRGPFANGSAACRFLHKKSFRFLKFCPLTPLPSLKDWLERCPRG
jgi:hypothetical protein